MLAWVAARETQTTRRSGPSTAMGVHGLPSFSGLHAQDRKSRAHSRFPGCSSTMQSCCIPTPCCLERRFACSFLRAQTGLPC
jgi:hypothetical protein